MATFKKIGFLPDKNEKRCKPFTAVMTDMKLVEPDNGGAIIEMEFGNEAPLKINLNYDKWVEDKEIGKTPKPGSVIYKFLMSLAEKDVEVEINDDLTEIKTSPSLLGKEVTFDCIAKTFNDKNEVDEDGKPKVITFYTWIVKKISEQSTLANVGATRTVTAPSQPTQQVAAVAPAPAANVFDFESVKADWMNILSSDLLPEKFSMSTLLEVRNKCVSSFQNERRILFTAAVNMRATIDALVNGGYLSKSGNDFVKNNDAIALESLA